MASIVPHKDQWRVHLFVKGRRESRLFRTKREARVWAWRREREIEVGAWAPPDIQLLPLEDLKSLPEVGVASTQSGVYFLWKADQIVYIGQSRNVAKRLCYHRKKPPAPFSRATVLVIPHPWQLAVEQIYIDAYLPSMALSTDAFNA